MEAAHSSLVLHLFYNIKAVVCYLQSTAACCKPWAITMNAPVRSLVWRLMKIVCPASPNHLIQVQNLQLSGNTPLLGALSG